MEHSKVFILGGKEFTVILPFFQDIKKSVYSYKANYYKQDYDSELDRNRMLYKLHSEDYSTFDEVEKDIDLMMELVNELENDIDLLKNYVGLIKKKKNGTFWLKSGYCIKDLESCTEYFTDFTNAWSTPELRLDVISETECTLRFRYRTRTN